MAKSRDMKYYRPNISTEENHEADFHQLNLLNPLRFDSLTILSVFRCNILTQLHVYKNILTCNYRKEYNNMMTVTLEGDAEGCEMNVKDKITYSSFRRRFPEHRIYLQGYTLVKK
jgi:hypothetical protein